MELHQIHPGERITLNWKLAGNRKQVSLFLEHWLTCWMQPKRACAILKGITTTLSRMCFFSVLSFWCKVFSEELSSSPLLWSQSHNTVQAMCITQYHYLCQYFPPSSSCNPDKLKTTFAANLPGISCKCGFQFISSLQFSNELQSSLSGLFSSMHPLSIEFAFIWYYFAFH